MLFRSLSFASMFALMALLGILSKSTGLVAAVGFVHATYLTEVLSRQSLSLPSFTETTALQKAVGALYYILPQVSDLRDGAVRILGGQPVFLSPYLVTILSSAAMLGAAILIFRRMDF